MYNDNIARFLSFPAIVTSYFLINIIAQQCVYNRYSSKLYFNSKEKRTTFLLLCVPLVMYHVILLLFIVKTQGIIQIGRIQNASWILNLSQIDNQYINISNITCDQCLCQMIEMNNLTISAACQTDQKTCQIVYWNATTRLRINTNSLVYVKTMPNFTQTIPSQQSMTTSMSSQGKRKYFVTLIENSFSYSIISFSNINRRDIK